MILLLTTKNNYLMENKNFEYSGWKINGFVALFLIFLLLGGGIYLIVAGANGEAKTRDIMMIVGGIVVAIFSLVACGGFMLLEPNEARVLTFFGKYVGSFYKTGFWWVNFLISAKNISLRARNLNAEPIKVNDKTGNPIMIGLVLVWKLKKDEIYRAVFDIDVAANPATGGVTQYTRMKMLESFVAVQSDAALRQVAGCYAYDDNTAGGDAVTLRSSSEEINDLLEERLSERLAIAGIEVVEARINYLAYAPEIAAVMLRRQQADAIISAREKIVEGAVSMVKMALDKLSTEEIVELDDERKAAMVTNLLVVLCADESAQPVVNAGTLHH
jgi:regulator of protease activity HflC (stomatin/prohibitin superfamily)